MNAPTAPNRWRGEAIKAARRSQGLERMILGTAAYIVETEEGLRVALACGCLGLDTNDISSITERIQMDRVAGLAIPEPSAYVHGPQWHTAVAQIAASRGGLDGMILTEAAKHVVSEEGFRVALGALRIPIDEGWVEHLRAAGQKV